MIFNFKIKGTTLFKTKDKQQDNLSYYKCKFYFDRLTWGNTEITAIFSNNMGYSKSIFLGKYEDVLSCTIPKNIIINKSFKVFLRAKNLQTNELSIYLFPKKQDKVERDQAIENILQQMDKKIDNVKINNQQLEFYSNNNLISSVYIDNVDERTIKKYVQIYFNNFQIQFQEQMSQYLTEDDIDFEDGILYIK